MKFFDSWYFVLLTILPLLLLAFYFALSANRKNMQKLGDLKLVKNLVANFSKINSILKFSLGALAVTMLVLALANLRKPSEKSEVTRKGVDIIFALDVSKSMLAQDIQPDRLTRAKQFLQRLVDKLPDDRIGLVLFAGRAYLQMPLSTDHSAATMYIQQASPSSVPTQGTVLSEALQTSSNAFISKERKYRSLVIISDGEDHDPRAVTLAQELAGRGIMINTIGIGSPNGSQIIDPSTGTAKRDQDGNVVVSRLNEAELQQLAAITGGIYTRLNDVDASVKAVVQQLGTIEKTAVSDTEFRDYTSYFQWFVIAAFLFLLIEFFLPERKRRMAVATSLFFFISSASAQQPDKFISKGNNLYRQGEYAKAADQYRKSLERKPDNALTNFNLANALYRQQQFADAEQVFTRNLEHTTDPAMLNRIYYNKGLAHTRKKELEASIDAYKQALIHDPTDADARYNLQIALRELNKNKQSEKKDKKDNQQKDQKQQQQKSKLNKKQVENLLKVLQQREQDVQKKYQQNRSRATSQPEKDW